jgi:S-DNA-T family DNA segregation ATPase FtsK/SpoIIIE
VSTEEQNFVHELVNLKVEPREEGAIGQLKKRDDLYEAAVDIVVREGRGSVSLLQRSLGVGYGRAARLIDYMAEDSIVGPYAGSQAREVLISLADWERMQSGSEAPPRGPTTNATAALGTRRRPNRILPDGDSDEQEGEQPADAWSKRAVRPQDFDEPLDEAADEAEEDEEPTESDEAFLSDRTPEEEEVETDLLDAETYEDERNRYRAETA